VPLLYMDVNLGPGTALVPATVRNKAKRHASFYVL